MGYKQPRLGRLAGTGRKLKVDAVLQGSVVHFDSRLRITAQLLSVTKEEHLWAESYKCNIGDILAFQIEVAEKIAAQITRRLTQHWKRQASFVPLVRIADDAHL